MADNALGKLSMQVDHRDGDIGPDDAPPSVETTLRFLALCHRYGSPGQPRHAGPGQPRTGASGRSGPPPRCVRRSSTSRMRARL